jgi:[acyl-carrier-protein] S-malonyltransferase
MKPAQDRLAGDLNALRLRKPVYPVACNVDAEMVADDLRARDTLLRQVTGSVKWDACVRLLIAQGVQTFIEVGPGKVLCGLMRQIDRAKTSLNVSDETSLNKTLESLAKAPV